MLYDCLTGRNVRVCVTRWITAWFSMQSGLVGVKWPNQQLHSSSNTEQLVRNDEATYVKYRNMTVIANGLVDRIFYLKTNGRIIKQQIRVSNKPGRCFSQGLLVGAGGSWPEMAAVGCLCWGKTLGSPVLTCSSSDRLCSSRPVSRSPSVSKVNRINENCKTLLLMCHFSDNPAWHLASSGGCGVSGGPGCFLRAGRAADRSVCLQAGTQPHPSWGQTSTHRPSSCLSFFLYFLTNVLLGFLQIFHYFSLALLTFFMVELMGKLYAYRWEFFEHKFEVFDGLIVVISFVLDIVFIFHEDAFDGLGLLILLRLWRVARIING